MEVKEVSIAEFGEIFPNPSVIYSSSAFNELNSEKAEKIKSLVLYSGGKPVAGQIFGLRDGEWRAPYSAPFSSVTASGRDVDKSLTDEFYRHVADMLGSPVRLVLPPPFYPGSARPSFGETIDDRNYHYPLERFDDYEAYLSRSGRYSHHRAKKHSFGFFKTEDIRRAYGIIDTNRRAMGYTLAMSCEQVVETINVVPADFFIMTLNDEDCAAAMLYHVSPSIMQVIYWGDLPESRYARAMNHLAWNVFGWYAKNRPDINVIDIGPASTNGILNEGLAQFKLSIGCVETIRPTVMLNKI